MGKIIENKQLFIRRTGLIMYDIFAVLIASLMGIMVRFDFVYQDIPVYYIDAAWTYIPFNMICTIIIFFLFRMYQSLWIYAGFTEMYSTFFACALSTFVQYFILQYLGSRLYGLYSLPRSLCPKKDVQSHEQKCYDHWRRRCRKFPHTGNEHK